MVWSDNEAVIQELNSVLEYLEGCKKGTLPDVLDKVYSTLNKVQQHQTSAPYLEAC